MQKLLEKLLNEASSLERFQQRLIQCAEQLNKSDAYLRIAHLIVDELRKQQSVNEGGEVRAVDRFTLRYSVMQALNPLKAKIILFALWHEHQHPNTVFKSETAAQFTLDELLRKALQYYPSLTLLETGLYTIAPKLDELAVQDIVHLSDTLKSLLKPYIPHVIPFPEETKNDEIDWPQESLGPLLLSQNRSLNTSISQEL